MEFASRKRPRRLVLVAAVLALSAAIFAAVQAPLRAQDETFVSFKLPSGKNAFALGRNITANGHEETFTVGQKRTTRTVTGMTLSEVIKEAKADVDGVGVFSIPRDGQPLYASRGSRVFFYIEGREIHWLVYDEKNRVLEGDFGSEEARLAITGYSGELLSVEVASDPEEDIRAGDEVKISAEVSDGESGEDFTYRWVDGDGKVVSREESFTTTFKKKGTYPVSVDVRGSGDSRGSGGINVAVGAKKKTDSGGK